MKICPKCKFLDMEDFGPHYECPKCGVIYSRAEEVVRDEKFWKRKGEESYYQTASRKNQGNEQRSRSKKRFEFDRNLMYIFWPSWNWDLMRKGIRKSSTIWLWIGLMATASIVTGINIQRNLGNENYFPNLPKNSVKAEERFVTKYEVRTNEALDSEFEVISNDAPNTIFILLDKTSKQKKALVYVKRNERTALKVPEGEYAYQMIEGQEWINDQEHFGRSTVYKDGETTLDFGPKMKRVVTLKTIEGNMHPRKAGRIELN